MQLNVSMNLHLRGLGVLSTPLLPGAKHRTAKIQTLAPLRGALLIRRGNDESASTTPQQDPDVSQEGAKRETIERINREAMEAEASAQKRVEKDLYSANWAGDVYIGSRFNLLTILLAISILVPIGGLVFAYFTYGTLWGVEAVY